MLHIADNPLQKWTHMPPKMIVHDPSLRRSLPQEIRSTADDFPEPWLCNPVLALGPERPHMGNHLPPF
jgi:hypothetical protein